MLDIFKNYLKMYSMNVIKVSIKEMAQKRGYMTAYQLQKATGAQPNLAAKWYRNDLKSIGIETINLLCNVLKCTPSDLLQFTPDKNQ